MTGLEESFDGLFKRDSFLDFLSTIHFLIGVFVPDNNLKLLPTFEFLILEFIEETVEKAALFILMLGEFWFNEILSIQERLIIRKR